MNRRKALQSLGVLPAGLAAFGALPASASDQTPSASAPTGPARRTIAINGADLNYSIAGEANDHPLICLHGGRGQGQHESLFKALEPLSDKYKVIGFDMRGHGHSSVTAPFTFDQMVEDIEQLRLTLGGGRKMVLQGGSFGGFIALSYAVKYPQNLSHLILRGTAPSYRHEEEAMGNFRARAAERAPAATPGMLTKIFTPTITDDEEFRMIMFALAAMYLPEHATPDYDKILEASRQGIYRARVHNDLYEPAMWHAYDVIDRLKTITAPTLVICGARDWICDPAQSRLMASHLPDAELVEVPGVDHSIPADILMPTMRSFLDRHA